MAPHLRWFCALLWLLASACNQEAPESIYLSAEKLERKGELKAALTRAQAGLRRYRNPDSEWHWKFRLLVAEIFLDRGRSKEALSTLKTDGDRGPRQDELRARWLADVADARFWLGSRSAAREAWSEAVRLATACQAWRLLANIQLHRAPAQETFDQAEACFRNSLKLASDTGDAWLVAKANAGLGFNRYRYDRFDEAIPWFELARDQALALGEQRLLSNTLGNLGTCYLRLGDFDRALPLLDRAASLANEIQDDRNLQFWIGNIGKLFERTGDYPRAIDYYRQAKAVAERRDDPDWLSTVLNYLAEAALHKGDVAAATEFNQQSLNLRAKLDTPVLLLHPQLTTARILARENRLDQTESRLEKIVSQAKELRASRVLWEAHAELASLYRSQRTRDAQDHYRQAISTIRTEWSKLSREESKITFLANLIRFHQDYVDFLVELGRSEEALAVAESVRARALTEKLGLSQPKEPDFRISDLQQRLPERTVLLVYWTAPRRSVVWAITRNGLSQFPLPASVQLREVVGRYNQLIVGRKDPLDREYGVEKELYDSVLAPVHSMIPPRARVIVVPDGPLHELNFETILVRNGQPRYWIEDVTISVAPSLHVLSFDLDASPRRRNVLFIGDPISPSQDFPALSHLKEELAAIERTFPKSDHTAYASERATPDAYRAAHPEQYYAIHFAAHATASPESPLNSAVVLSKKGDDFKLYARDVVNLPISAALVTVSGCRSAGAKVYSGEGLIGFAWAFLRAGARNVIGGLWDVDDGATSQIMGRLYENLAAGATPAEALREAKLKLLGSSSLYRKPYFWAPFPIFTRSVARERAPTLLSRR